MTFERRLRSSLWKCTDLMQIHEKRYRELEVRKVIIQKMLLDLENRLKKVKQWHV